MDMMKMLGQLQESQKKVEEAKNRMSKEYISEVTSDNLLTATVYKNGRVKELSIDDELLEDKEQLVDYLILTLNKALEKAENEFDTELERITKQGMPNIPGLSF